MRRIVVTGGSFNPPTAAHLALMCAALEQTGVEQGVFVPSSEAYVVRKMSRFPDTPDRLVDLSAFTADVTAYSFLITILKGFTGIVSNEIQFCCMIQLYFQYWHLPERGGKSDKYGFPNIRFFVDDGYTGTNFSRPAMQELLSLVDAGQVGTIIVKDMSRFGRDYLQVGHYTDVYFS